MESPKIKQNNNHLDPVKNSQEVSNSDLSLCLLAKQVVIKGESKKEFIDLVVKILKETHISTEIEKEFVKKYIFSMWKLRRARIMEKNLLNEQQKFSKDEVYFSNKKMRIRNLKRIHLSEGLQKIINYQDKLEKQAIKALRQIKQFEKIL